MKYFVYILYSLSHQKSYVGYTNDINRRLWEHNNSIQKSFTSNFRPWIVIHQEEFVTKKEAMSREKWFKSSVGRGQKTIIISQFLNLQVRYPSLAEKD